MASIGEEFEELVTKARRLNERRDLSAKQSKELATTLANAEAAAAYGKKLAKRVKTTEAEMVVSGQRHVDKLLAKVDKLAVRPEETRKFRATIEKAKGMTAALARFRTRRRIQARVWSRQLTASHRYARTAPQSNNILNDRMTTVAPSRTRRSCD